MNEKRELDEGIVMNHNLSMDELNTHTAQLDENDSFIEAAMSVSRLDEAQAHLESSEIIYTPGARRRESMAIASIDGAIARMESLCRVISDPDITNVERGSRVAADAYTALQLVEAWTEEGPNTSDIVELFSKADSSAGRLMRPDIQWSIEEDAMWIVEQVKVLSEACTPTSAVETIRAVWASGRFLGTSRRMALLIAPWVIAKGFKCRWPIYGLSEAVKSKLDHFRDAAQTSHHWNAEFSTAMNDGFAKERQRLKDAFAQRTALLALCPPTRNSSSIEPAINFVFKYPSFTAKLFAEHLNITPRGAKVVLDRLLETNVIEVDAGARNRKFTCRRVL